MVRFIGDQVAAVVAHSEAEAAAAVKLIQVEYEDLPIVSDPVAGMQPDASRVHEHIGDSNICVHYKIRKGDVHEGFEKADVIVESEYHTPVQEHAYLQPEAGLGMVRGLRLDDRLVLRGGLDVAARLEEVIPLPDVRAYRSRAKNATPTKTTAQRLTS